MKLSYKQQFGIGLLSAALISTLASMGIKLFRSIKETTIRNNCVNYPIENVDTDDMQTFEEEELTEQSQILVNQKDYSNIGEYK